MSQIFCERTLTGLGLAVVHKGQDEKLMLLALYPEQGDSLDDFPEALNKLIAEHKVTSISVTPMTEGEGHVSDIPELQGIPDDVEVCEVRKIVKPLSGRIARATMLKAGLVDETTEYKQADKLSERISRIDKADTVAPDLAAYMSAVVLAEAEYFGEDMDLGSFDTTPNDITKTHWLVRAATGM